jgi:Ca-activated chloride channel family protein
MNCRGVRHEARLRQIGNAACTAEDQKDGQRTGEVIVKRLCLLVMCLGVPVHAQAQVPLSPADNQVSFHDGPAVAAVGDTPTTTFRSGVDLVALNVVVTDSAERFVTGLASNDFAVFEDGVQQDVSFFGASDIPLDLAILLDTSASMSDKLQTAQQAAIGFVSTLRESDRVSIIDIKDATKVLFPMAEDMAAAREAILGTTARGGTALYNGTYLALKEMTKLRRANGDVRRQAIVVLSDGADTASLLSYDDVLELAKESGIAIYTISLRSKSDIFRASQAGHRYFSQSDFGMKALAQETGAKAYFPNDISELAGVYSSIAQELASQYALGYTSKNPKKDGGYRRVIVRITAQPGVRTRTRNGYLAARIAR